jgi:hypothetical protein
MSRIRRRAGSKSRGAVIVEAAIITPILFLFVFGAIEIGILMSSISATSSGARDGARYAAATLGPAVSRQTVANQVALAVEQDLKAMTGFGTPVEMWVYHSRNDTPATEGFPLGTTNFTSGCATDCYRYLWNASTGHFVTNGAEDWVVDACIAGGIDSVGVYVRVAHRSPVGLFGSRTLREHSNVRIEPLPLAQCPG